MSGVVESHRLTGPHLLGDHPGAALDVAIDSGSDATVAAWRGHARRLLDAIGWGGEEIASRSFAGGASLVISAPVDGLYAATEINEAAWEAAVATISGAGAPDEAAVLERLRAAIVREHDNRLRALRDAARVRGVSFLSDAELVSVGSGRGARVWPRTELPAAAAVDWTGVHDVPIVLVTGSNGKTTSARLLAAIAAAAGLTAALTSTDGVTVGADRLASGDYAGPMGARLALRHPGADLAVLETARGGILRRGLAVEHADVTLITNIAADHLEDGGVTDLATLAATKLVAARVVRPGGRVVLNADDPGLATYALGVAPAMWFALDRATPLVAAELAAGGDVAFLDDDTVMLARGGQPEPVERLGNIPFTLGGAARYNVSNALGVVAAASALGIPADAMAAGLRSFSRSGENPGRLNLFDVGGVGLLVDYGHNPHGVRALRSAVDAMAGERRAVVVGQAGDRSDDAIRDLAAAAWEMRPTRVILKELPTLRRGRAPGSVVAVMAEHFRQLGATDVIEVESEVDAVNAAMAWARPGDFVVMLTHENRSGVLARLDQLGAVPRDL